MACKTRVDGYANELAAELASTLDWWREAGVDTLVQDDARAWLNESARIPGAGRSQPEGQAKKAAAAPSSLGSGPSTSSLRDPAPLSITERNEEPLPDQLDLLQDWLRTSPFLPYATPHAPRICPMGDPAAGLMIVAAMPSSEDCSAGSLLSGAAGRLFDRMLAAIGRTRDSVYLAGLSCFRPVGGRFDREGSERCAAIARRHVALAAPRAVLLLGYATSKALLGLGAVQARGKVHRIEADGRSFEAIVTLSPEYLLQQPAAKAMAWADLQLLEERLAAAARSLEADAPALSQGG